MAFCHFSAIEKMPKQAIKFKCVNALKLRITLLRRSFYRVVLQLQSKAKERFEKNNTE